MSLFGLVTADEVDDLPENPQAAFVEFVRIADARLTSFEEKVDNDHGEHAAQSKRHAFMNIVVGAAKQFDVDSIANLTIPRRTAFEWSDYQDFRADLEHCITQILIQDSSRRRKDSVPLSDDAKSRIRAHVHALRECIDRASNISEAKRAKLHERLGEFEAALEKARTSLFAVSRIVFEILSVTANVVAVGESPTIQKLLMNVMEVVAIEKASAEERRLPSPPDQALLPAPPEVTRPKSRPSKKRPDFDDEIPF